VISSGWLEHWCSLTGSRISDEVNSLFYNSLYLVLRIEFLWTNCLFVYWIKKIGSGLLEHWCSFIGSEIFEEVNPFYQFTDLILTGVEWCLLEHWCSWADFETYTGSWWLEHWCSSLIFGIVALLFLDWWLEHWCSLLVYVFTCNYY